MCFVSTKSVRKSLRTVAVCSTKRYFFTVSSEFNSNVIIGLDHTNIVKGVKYKVNINAIYSAKSINTSYDTVKKQFIKKNI